MRKTRTLLSFYGRDRWLPGICCIMVVLSGFLACKKTGTGDMMPSPGFNTPVDPATSSTIGFFMDDWQAKQFTPPAYVDMTPPGSSTATVTVDMANVVTKISRFLFGNNANVWMGQCVTEPVLLKYITDLQPHILRFPGGSISNLFFWNANKGVKPATAPDLLPDANGTASPARYWFGFNTDNWTCSVDNYYQMLQQTGNQGVITINYGYARYGTGLNPVADAAHLAADWVRYDRGRTKCWEIGNENFGNWEAGYRIKLSDNKNGQPEYITGALYATHFKVFADSMRAAASETGARIYIGAVMVEGDGPSQPTNIQKTWNSGLFSNLGNAADYYVVHNYYTPYRENSDAAEILASAETVTQDMMHYLQQTFQAAGMAPKPVALDEWNTFAAGSMQQVSHINGMHAVLLLSELMRNKYGMGGRWDLADGWNNGNDYGLFNIGDEPGAPKWNPRPAFYHMYFYQKCLGDRLVSAVVEGGRELYASASSFSSGQAGIVLVNKSTTAQPVSVVLNNFRTGARYYWYQLTGGEDNGEFSRKVIVNGNGPGGDSGGPAGYATLKAWSAPAQGGVTVSVPARAVVFLVVDKK